MKGKCQIKVGNIVKKINNPGSTRLGVVVATGADHRQIILEKWFRVRYINAGDYEWVQTEGLEILTSDRIRLI